MRRTARPPASWLPADVPVIVTLLVITNAVVGLSPWQSLRVTFGLVLLLVLPGYATLTLLFPYGNDPDGPTRSGIDGLERAALSFGTSVALLPPLYLLAFVIAGGSAPSTMIVFGVLDGFILVVTLLGFFRRLRIDPAHRFDLPARRLSDGLDERSAETDRRTLLANVALGVAAVGTIGTLVYAITSPPDGEHFSEFYLVTENDTGEYTAGNYRTTLTAGEPETGVLGIENHEGRTITYATVAELQRVDATGESVEVLERGARTRETITLAAGRSKHVQQEITPSMTGENLRLHYRLYRGAPDGDPPYRELQLWVDVTEGSGGPPGSQPA